ncbi:hypothetical protein [Bacillus badius]|uniref:Phage protein n=1 Tax=Bacillus badius TaxID=1455 RepID=A0ABR5ANV0_BACBA|nr:hypothetical protein [Bacillus badius]KIL72715.1 Phage protein [Bacillus badius]MED4715438.1 hypothetical protein [Bacillus badius]
MLVHNKGEHARHIGVYLNPGTNELSEEEAAKFTKVYENPRLQHLMSDIEVVKENEDESSSAFAKLTADKAIELVKATSEIALLEEFRADEVSNNNRKTVLKAIDSQVEVLNQPHDEEPFIDGQE